MALAVGFAGAGAGTALRRGKWRRRNRAHFVWWEGFEISDHLGVGNHLVGRFCSCFRRRRSGGKVGNAGGQGRGVFQGGFIAVFSTARFGQLLHRRGRFFRAKVGGSLHWPVLRPAAPLGLGPPGRAREGKEPQGIDLASGQKTTRSNSTSTFRRVSHTRSTSKFVRIAQPIFSPRLTLN